MTNIIRAIFNCGKSTATATRPDNKPIYQWDYGKILEIHGLDLPKATEVHFSHSMGGSDAVIRIGTTADKITSVAVPEAFLEQAGDVTAYVYKSDTMSGQTEYKISFKVIERLKPEAWDTPEDGELFREVIEVVNSAADKAESGAERAEIAAGNAEQSAQDAEASATASKASENVVKSIADGFSETVDSAKVDITNHATNEKEQAISDIKAQGEEVQENISESANTAKTDLDTAINNASTTKSQLEQVITNVDAAGESQVQAVKNAGVAQVQAVQQEGADQIQIMQSHLVDYAKVEEVSELRSDLDNYLKVKENILETDNLLNVDNMSQGYVDMNGNVVTDNTNFKHTDYEYVKPNTTYTVWRMNWKNNFNYRFVCQYDENKNVISGAGSEMASSFTTDENAYYVIISFDNNENITEARKPMVVEGTDVPSEYKPYRNEYALYETEYVSKSMYDIKVSELEERIDNVQIKQLVNSADIITSDSIASGENISIDASNSKQNNTIGFFCNIADDFDSIRISHGLVATHGRASSVVVDSTNLTVYSDQNTVVATYPHGLTLCDFIQVSIAVGNKYTATVAITTNGGYFNKKDVEWNGCTESVKVESIGGTLTNTKLSWHVSDYNHNIWCFGDSYFDYWIPYIKNYLGIYGYMQDSYGGRASAQALTSLKLAIKKAIPKAILWCMGMNDADSESEINASWKSCADELISICNENNINIVFATIPNTPDRNHTYKNAYIKASGEMYVDIAHTVGADTYPSAWLDGLISSDNVHPSGIGTKVIANAMIIGCPELTEQVN